MRSSLHPHYAHSTHPEWSGKLETLYRLMDGMRRSGDDRIVVVSNYTSTLDLIGNLCREHSWPYSRLDGRCAERSPAVGVLASLCMRKKYKQEA
jgi:SNF2 family DNA or RNA helicase